MNSFSMYFIANKALSNIQRQSERDESIQDINNAITKNHVKLIAI